MKRKKIIFSMIVCSFFSCGNTTKVIDTPYWESSTTNTFSISRIELTDTASVIHFMINNDIHRPWMVSSGIHLLKDGKKYRVHGGKCYGLSFYGKCLPKEFHTDSIINKNSQIANSDSLILYFDPLPRNTNKFDVVEDNKWKVEGIRTIGKPYQSKLGKEYNYNEDKNKSLPAFKQIMGNAVLKGHIYGSNLKHVLRYLDPLTNAKMRLVCNPDSVSGEYFISINTPTAIYGWLGFNFKDYPVMLTPGDTLTLDIDAVAVNAERNSEYNPTQYKDKTLPVNHRFSGNLASINEYLYLHRALKKAETSAKDTVIDHTTRNEMLWKKYHEELDSINADKRYNRQIKEYLKLKSQADYLYSRVNGDVSLTDVHVVDLPILNDPNGLYVITDTTLLPYLEANKMNDCWLYKWMNDFKHAQELVHLSLTARTVINDSLLNSLNPIYVPEIKQMNDFVKLDNDSMSAVKICSVDVNITDSVMKYIINKYRGSVVFIDCWATWCGTCKLDMNKLKSIKKEYAGKNVKFLYLTDETSDYKLWLRYIKDIPGDHYLLTKKQWKMLPNGPHYGYPEYYIYDCEGKQSLHLSESCKDLPMVIRDNLNKCLEVH
jgi:thiol-disulfide isomerase/thioredoxin